MDPIELARTVGMMFFKAQQFLAAAILYGEAAKRAPDNPAVLLGFGASVGDCAGVMVVEPFVQWSTRILERCIAKDNGGQNTPVARARLAELAQDRHYVALPPIEPADIEPLLAFLDVSPSTTMVEAVAALPDDDRMMAIMALGELGSPRFASAIAGAVSGQWGHSPANAAFKRLRPFAGHRIVREAMQRLRANAARAEECEPYLRSAEAAVASTPITIDTPEGYSKVRPPPARPVGAAPSTTNGEPPNKPWWKFW